ncbi:MAG: ABC-type multidrug transport system fused ATPase/permease subunit [Phenylobacterium sp.]|jgi:ABC-type multidrug transport system fused ATPase/permease subunit
MGLYLRFLVRRVRHFETVESIRDAIAIVEQEPTLFAGTIAENIAYASKNSESD